jgi:ATP-binding cassette subfamily C protein LapB
MNNQSAASQSTTSPPIGSHSTAGQATDSQPATSQQPSYAPWLTAMLGIARHYRIETSEENIRINLDWEKTTSLDTLLHSMARQIGLELRFDQLNDAMLDAWRLPVVVEFKSGQVGILEKVDSQGNVSVQFSGDHGLATTLATPELKRQARRVLILRPATSVADVRVDEYIKPYQKNWFWGIIFKDWKRYGDIMLASLVANVLALSAIIFSMQVYDRVIPAQSIPTLWVLAGGVLIAVVFEFSLRVSRIHVSDIIGKRADLRVSDRVFGHALRIRNSERSKSTGTFISQIRELESVRELVTSTTISALADLPFFFLFLVIFWIIGGPLVFIILLAIPLILIPGLLIQKPLARLSNEGMRESSIRNATLVEAVQGIEDIKLLRAEPRFQNQWNHLNEVSADISKRQRFISGLLLTWTQELQTIMYALVVLAGCFLVIEGEMTTGALVGCSLLSSRMIAPLAQISGVMSRWQQAKVARQSLDELIKRPVDQPDHASLIHRSALLGNYQLHNVSFKYNADDSKPVLNIKDLNIRAGEKVAILGRNGAGKTTLLQLLSGMQFAQSGQVMLDDLDLTLIDPADVRRDMGLLNQNAHLFFGTLRENLTLGSPLVNDQEILNVLNMVGALHFVQSRKEGLDYVILEGGTGLSGGQKQMLLLARLLIRQPNIILLDEPTAAIDEVTEKQLIDRLKLWLGHRTLVVATHRMAVLSLVDRVIVVNDGQVVMDGPRDQVLATSKSRLQQG